MKKILLVFLLLTLLTQSIAYAQSPYVLPYPSTMPGGISYKLHLVWEKIMEYWYFGDFGQFTYNLKESDKYLVEAKTLFEYNQYLLGFLALQKSNFYWNKLFSDLQKAKTDGKDIFENRTILRDAAQKHIEVLQKMVQETPSDFNWNPEKSSTSRLHIHELIQQSVIERQKDL